MIGEAGVGVVWEALDIKTNEVVAIKQQLQTDQPQNPVVAPPPTDKQMFLSFFTLFCPFSGCIYWRRTSWNWYVSTRPRLPCLPS